MTAKIDLLSLKELDERESKKLAFDYSFLHEAPLFKCTVSGAEMLAQMGVHEVTLVQEDGVELPRIFVGEYRDDQQAFFWEEGAGDGQTLVRARFYNAKGGIVREVMIHPPIQTGKGVTPGINLRDLSHPFF